MQRQPPQLPPRLRPARASHQAPARLPVQALPKAADLAPRAVAVLPLYPAQRPKKHLVLLPLARWPRRQRPLQTVKVTLARLPLPPLHPTARWHPRHPPLMPPPQPHMPLQNPLQPRRLPRCPHLLPRCLHLLPRHRVRLWRRPLLPQRLLRPLCRVPPPKQCSLHRPRCCNQSRSCPRRRRRLSLPLGRRLLPQKHRPSRR
mmetsp:Transcript_8744/g.26166  ORF Transcript_8744/g.26166 Transcript_8744/m.26166 type:complete len:202 (+) Transcript_8744:1566-2171(+)